MTPSPAQVGAEALEVAKDRIADGVVSTTGHAVFTPDEFKLAAAFATGQERAFNLFLVPILSRSLQRIVVALSEEFTWLPVHTSSSHADKLKLKPDIWLGPDGFYALKVLKAGSTAAKAFAEAQAKHTQSRILCAVPADRRLFPSVIPAESKIPNNNDRVPTANNLGQALNYGGQIRLDALGADVLGQTSSKVMIFTPTVFWLLEVGQRSFLSRLTKWKWDTPGSLEALRDFVPVDPWQHLHTLCSQLQVRLLQPKGDGDTAFLGAGACARVFLAEDGNEQQHALKVVCNGHDTMASTQLRMEFAVLEQHRAECKSEHCFLVAKPTSQMCTAGKLAAFTMAPVGAAVTREMINTGKVTVQAVFTRLVALHQHGLTHGDARLANLVLTTNKTLTWIDLRTGILLQGVDSAPYFVRDARTLVRSLLPAYNPDNLIDADLEAAIDAYKADLTSADSLAGIVAARFFALFRAPSNNP